MPDLAIDAEFVQLTLAFETANGEVLVDTFDIGLSSSSSRTRRIPWSAGA
jgi:hypothetical protein